MADLHARLRDYFSARTLLKSAPLWALAGGAGVIIGTAIATPAFATAGLGLVLTSLAANMTSSMVYDLVKPELDDERREQLIARGLKQRDPGVIRLVAEALTQAGPDLARALADATRTQLVALLESGMQEPGGALAAIAPRYADALRNPPADWRALQAELQQTITSVSQTIEAAEGGVISGGQMRAEHVSGPVEQVMRATGRGSRIENSSQTAVGGAGSGVGPGRAGAGKRDTARAGTTGDREHMRRLLESHTRRLHELENRAATEGIRTPPEVTTEMEDIRAEIARLQQQLGA
ncbi:MAG: hypothetical protein ACJ8CR_37300 [Roseiflexaceae bacterium]